MITGRTYSLFKTGKIKLIYPVRPILTWISHPDGFISLKSVLRIFSYVSVIFSVTVFYTLAVAPMIPDNLPPLGPQKVRVSPFADTASTNQMFVKYNKELRSIEDQLARFGSRSPYLVVNTSKNEFSLYNGKKLIRKGICSTGSYVRLEYDGQKEWIFRTPKGLFKIQSKTTNPVWKKPDWAFVEEGKTIPPPGDPSRFEYGVLGDYSLSLGDGYLIHGTLYQRMLGLPVTHGCIRLGDKDLEAVYNTMKLGNRVLIY